MNNIQSHLLKKNFIDVKPKKKSIPININTNQIPSKFIFSNHVNKIASSYLSMGQKFKINKNVKSSKIIHVNTKSSTNYYIINNKESKQSSTSIVNSMSNNYKNKNKSDINYNNVNNYFNINSRNNNIIAKNYETKSKEKNHYNTNTLSIEDKRQSSIIRNSHFSNKELLINGYQSSKKNLNNTKLKNKINKSINTTTTTNTLNNISTISQTYSSRPNFLDSKNRTKKIPMKSRLRKIEFHYKNNKPSSSSSFSNVCNFKNIFQIKSKDNKNYSRENPIKENNIEYFSKYNKNYKIKSLINKNLYEIKNRHFRNNTTSFGKKQIINILHKNNSSKKSINLNCPIHNGKNIIIISHINNKNNRNSNINQIKNSIIKCNSSIETYSEKKIIFNRIPNINNSRRKIKQLNNRKINDIKINVKEKSLNRLNINQNGNNSNRRNNLNNHNHNFYRRINTISINNNIQKNFRGKVHHQIHQIKHLNSNNTNNIKSNNTNFPSFKKVDKIVVNQKVFKKINVNKNNIINRQIDIPNQKIKNSINPFQKNIKINLDKLLRETKNKQNTKLNMGKKSLSIKRISNENNSDFFINNINDKLPKIEIKKDIEIKGINNTNINNRKNIRINIGFNEENSSNKEKIENKDKDKGKNIKREDGSNNILIEITDINNKELNNKLSNKPTHLINDISNNNIKKNIDNKNNYYFNYNEKNISTNNNYLSNKNNYSNDNIPEVNDNENNKIFNKTSEFNKIEEILKIQNEIDENNSLLENNISKKINENNINEDDNNKNDLIQDKKYNEKQENKKKINEKKIGNDNMYIKNSIKNNIKENISIQSIQNIEYNNSKKNINIKY